MAKKKLPIGVSEFENIMTDNGYYVDKTLLISDWLQTSRGSVTLITRPRRFGKTLNMTMLREFFDITKNSRALFASLAIEQTAYIAEMNQWPVIYLSFRGCKGGKEDVLKCLFKQLTEGYQKYYVQLQPDIFDQVYLKRSLDILLGEKLTETSSVNDCIFFLSKLLYKHYGKKVLILVDEYDTPMISAYEGGYYDDVRSFFRGLYSTALKDNPYLERAMLTGIHRIAKENIFSGLNNLEVCTVMDEAYCQYFGLTAEETEKLLQDYELVLDQAVKDMYDGYHFGSQEIYNPWSVINYAKTQRLAPYWVNTASDDMLSQMILSADKQAQAQFEQLLTDQQTTVLLDLQTSFFELDNPPTLWGMFLNSGYLTTVAAADPLTMQADICIPNQEVMTSFKKIFDRYGGFTSGSLHELFAALLRKDMVAFQRIYEQIILSCTSFHDGSAENAYHMLFLGMCVYLSDSHTVKSNIEQEYGRVDVSLKTKRRTLPNVVIEFKQGEDIDKLSQEALAQIHDKKYYAAFQGETLLLGIAHHIKHCQIAWEMLHI